MMKPSRELDAKIHATIFGGIVNDRFETLKRIPQLVPPAYEGDPVPIPFYSTDKVAALDVFNQLCRITGGRVKLVHDKTRYLVTNLHDDYWAQWDPSPNEIGRGDFFVEAQTIPMAICLAALKVME